MKNRIIIFMLFSIVFLACRTPAYLPSSEAIDTNFYGSHIKLFNKTGSSLQGELIAIDSSDVYVLMDDELQHSQKFAKISLQEVKYFNLKYARSKHYWWTIPTFTLITGFHGWWALLSAPLNFISTLTVSIGSEKSFKYSERNMSFEKLKMFARFPQGIPIGIDLSRLKH